MNIQANNGPEDDELEELALIWDEAIDDADSWERSNDEGWYYEDD